MLVVVAFIAVVIIWSTTPLAIQWSTDAAGAGEALLLRMLIGAGLSVLWLALRGEPLPWTWRALRLYAASAVGLAGAMSMVYWSAQYIASGLISVLFGLAPIFGGFYAHLWLGEVFFSVRRLLGAGIGLAGLVVIFHQQLHLGGDGWKGVLGLLAAVNMYALSSVWVKRLGGETSAIGLNTGTLLLSLPYFGVLWWAGGAEWSAFDASRGLWAIVYLGVFGSCLGFIAYYYVLRRVEAGSVLLITLITPVIALVLGGALNNERLDAAVWSGAALVISGLLVYQGPAVRAFARRCLSRRSPT